MQKDLAELEIQAAQIYGSSTYGKGFIEGVSDIDICVYTNKMGKMPDEKIVEIIKNSNKDFKDKEPVIITKRSDRMVRPFCFLQVERS